MAKLTRLQKSTQILANAQSSQWCYVNTDNEFTYDGTVYVIDESFEEYKVHNKAGIVYDYTNEAYMEEILVVITNDYSVECYNQNYDSMDVNLITVKE